jgi:pyridoxine 4-dehydrogenase
MSSQAVSAAAAGSWQLGDLTVSRLGFGAMRLTGRTAFGDGPPSDRGQSIRVLRRAVELGVNHIDTAAFYFSPLRSANELINRANGVTPAQVRLAWTLQQGPHGLVIPGTGNPGHLAENVAAAALRLSAADLARLAGT